MILWLTGLSGSGKSTIANIFINKFIKINKKFILIDGDQIRNIFENDLGYSLNDRIKQIKRIQNISKFLDNNSLNVIVAALYSNPELLNWNRDNFNNYFEVYIKSSLQNLKLRNKNKLYSKFSEKKNSQIVGLDIPWEEPINSDLIIETDNGDSPKKSAEDLFLSIKNCYGNDYL